MHDNNLWVEIKKSDQKAFEIIFKRYYKILVSYINQFTKNIDLAEDIVQKTFIDLWVKREKIIIKSSLKSFLFKVAYNKFIDDKRVLDKNKLLINNLKYDILYTNLECDYQEDERKINLVNKLINQLPDKCKEILLLSKRGNLKNREIAEKLKISIKTVETQITIAYKKIRKGYSSNNFK